MTRKKALLMVVAVISLLSASFTEGKTEDLTERWVLYGKSADGNSYYDRVRIRLMSPAVIQAWDKMEYSEIGKDKDIQWRKNEKLVINGYNLLAMTFTLFEIDCKKSIITTISTVDYDSKMNIIDLFSSNNPGKYPIVSGSRGELLSRKICPK